MTENKEVMARNIRYYMSLNKINSTEMCKTLGFKQSTFSNWINAKIYPRIDKIEKMANYFGISKADLVEEKPRAFDSGSEFELEWEKLGGGKHPIELSNHERRIVLSYRAAPESIKEAVDKLLDVDMEKGKKATSGA